MMEAIIFNSILKVGEPKTPERKKSARPFPKEKLPEPILPNHADFKQVYYAAWEMAWNKISYGTQENGFEPEYMDEGFNELIYQWDYAFITGFAVYGRNVFPVMPSLDNFYKKQRADGYIQRVYWETNGKIAHEPSADEPMTNPPLFAWIEWRYYEISGDSSRFSRVVPILRKYYEWAEINCRTEKGKGLFYSTELGSGMDNTLRKGVGKAAWIDYSAQHALAAKYISKMADVIGDNESKLSFQKKHDELKGIINKELWNSKTEFYHDLKEDGELSKTKHIGAFWTLLVDISTKNQTEKLLEHLENPAEFNRPHRVPTLSADQAEYDPKGHYWLGSVWAPTNYMVVEGLRNTGNPKLAYEIALNHLQNVRDIYFNFNPHPDSVAFDERYADEYKTLWECYSSEYQKPATRWDNTFYSRQDFVGWTGLGPIAMLIETVMGFSVKGNENLIEWTINEDLGDYGINKLQLRNQRINFAIRSENGIKEIVADAEFPFNLIINYEGKSKNIEIKAGKQSIRL